MKRKGTSQKQYILILHLFPPCSVFTSFSSPEPTILLACGWDLRRIVGSRDENVFTSPVKLIVLQLCFAILGFNYHGLSLGFAFSFFYFWSGIFVQEPEQGMEN